MERIYTDLAGFCAFFFVLSMLVIWHYKRRLHRAFRSFQGETQDNIMAEYLNFFFPIPYKSGNPDFYEINSNRTLAKKIRQWRIARFIFLGILILFIILDINSGY